MSDYIKEAQAMIHEKLGLQKSADLTSFLTSWYNKRLAMPAVRRRLAGGGEEYTRAGARHVDLNVGADGFYNENQAPGLGADNRNHSQVYNSRDLDDKGPSDWLRYKDSKGNPTNVEPKKMRLF